MAVGWVDLDLGSSPGWWAATVATYCPSRTVEHSKSKSTQPSCQTTSPTMYCSYHETSSHPLTWIDTQSSGSRTRAGGRRKNRQSDRSDADDVVEAEANPKSIIINNGIGGRGGGGGGGGRSEGGSGPVAVGRSVGRPSVRRVDQVSDLNAVLRRKRQHERGWQILCTLAAAWPTGRQPCRARPTRGQCGDHV